MSASNETEKLLPSSTRRYDPLAESGKVNVGINERQVRLGMQWGIPPRFALALLGAMLVTAAVLGATRFGEETTGDQVQEPSTPLSLPISVKNHEPPGLGQRGGEGPTLDDFGRKGKKDAGWSSDVPKESVADKPPNVIFVMLDDMGMNDLGLQSTDLEPMTPFLDSLIAGGVHLSRYYTNHICTPARSSLMSGRDTFRTGMQFEEIQNIQPWGLPLDEATLAERFKAAGYSTHMAGKWNLGMFEEEFYPFNRGFDTYLGYFGAQENYYSHTYGGYKDFGFGDEDGYINHDTNTTRWGPELEGVYSTSLTTDRAVQVATEHQENDSDTPLFLYLAFQAAHFPLESPYDWMFTEQEQEVLGTLTNVEVAVRLMFAKIVFFVDIALRRMVEELDAIGMMDNTLLVVASDNGGCPAYGGSNFPYRGFKHTLFEGGVRTPALVYSKSESIIPKEARGTSYEGMMHVTDWTQTLAGLTNIPTKEMGKPLSGFDHWSAIIGKAAESELPVRNELVLGRNSYVYDDDLDEMVLTDHPRGAFIYDGWKINVGDKCTGWFSFDLNDDVSSDPGCVGGHCPTCTDKCSYVHGEYNSFLFNLKEDPFEKYNLVQSMPDKFEEMVERWNNASAGEVQSNYVGADSTAETTWKLFHDWTVAWK